MSPAAAARLEQLLVNREQRLVAQRKAYERRVGLQSVKVRAEIDMEAPEPMALSGRAPSWVGHITAQPVGQSLGNGGYRR